MRINHLNIVKRYIWFGWIENCTDIYYDYDNTKKYVHMYI